MSVYGTSGSSSNSIYGPSSGGINAAIEAKFIDTEEIKAYVASVGLATAINSITPVSTLTTLCNLSETQTLTGQKTFSNGINSSNITLTGTTASGDLILYPRGTTANATRDIQFKELAANGNHHVALKAADTITASYNLILPSSGPTGAQVIRTDSFGNLSFYNMVNFASVAGYNTFTNDNTFQGTLDLSGTVASSTAGALTLSPWATAAGNTRELRFSELAANGSNFAAIKAPDSIPSTFTLTLPTALPASGSNFLSVDSSGNISTSASSLSLSGTSANWITGGLDLQPYGTGTGDTRHILFRELAANGSNFAALKAPDSIPVDFSITLPTGHPTSSQLITCSSTGALSYNAPVVLNLTGTAASSTAGALTLSPFGTAAGNTREIRFSELAANGTNHIAFKAADNMTTTNTYTLPSTAATANALLSTSSAGTMSWTDTSTFVSTTGNQSISGVKNFADKVTFGYQLLVGATSSSQWSEFSNLTNGETAVAIRNAGAFAAARSILRFFNDTASSAQLTFTSSSATPEWPNSLYINNTAGDIKIVSASTGITEVDGTLAITGTTPRLCVGTNSSSYLAEFRRTLNSDVVIHEINTSTGVAGRIIHRMANNTSSSDFIYNSQSHSTQPNNLIIKNNATAGNIRLQSGGTSTNFLTVLNGSGNVGLNVDTPTYLLHLNTDSAAKPTSSTWTISSDERLKTDIQDADLDICYENVKKLPLRRYKWRPEAYDKEQINDDWRRVGFIAQEYAKVFPKDVKAGLFQKTHKEEIKVIDEETKEEKTDYKTIVDFELKDCLSINTDQILTTLVGAVKKIQEVIDNQADAADYTVSPMQMSISEGYGIVSNTIKHFNHKNIATLSFNFIVDDDVTTTEWLELPLLQECKSVMLSNVIYIDEHGYDADRPFKISLSKSIDKLKVIFKNLNAVDKNIQKKLVINYIIQ
jgi:hypothetical protein